MSEALVLYEIKASAAVLTINRPDRRNAISRALIQALIEAFERARDDGAARSVILTGAGSVFCAGMDLSELQAVLQGDKGTSFTWDDARDLGHLFDLIYRLPKPTIAAVNGAAVAGGAGLASVCDLALSVPTAKFGYPEVRRGLVAALVMPHLLRHVGERAARYLLLTGELIEAPEAARIGLINEVIPAEQLREKAHAWAALLAHGGPHALASTKELLTRFSSQAAGVEATAHASAVPRLTEESRQGLRAFFDKKPVPWAPGA